MEGFTQAYAMITAFATDYAGAVSALRGVGEDDLARLRLRAEEPHDVRGGRQPAQAHKLCLFDRLKASEGGAVYKEIVAECGKREGDTVDALKVAREMGRFEDKGDSYAIPVGKRPNLYLLKPHMNLAGWQDTNEPGVFRRPKEG